MTRMYTYKNQQDNLSGNNTSHTFANIGGNFLAARIKGHICAPHFHDTYSIALVREGYAKCTIRDKPYTVSTGDIMIINPYEISFGGNDSDNFEYDVLYPDCNMMRDLIEHNFKDGNFPCFKDAVIHHNSATETIFHAVDTYLSSFNSRSTQAPIESAICNLLRDRDLQKDKIKCNEKNCNAIRIACDLIQNNHTKPVNLAHIADSIGLSRYYFIRMFQKFTKLKPSEYLRLVRLSTARRLIIEGSCIAGAAAESGFSDQAHMTRIFKKTFGFTPGQLKRDINQPTLPPTSKFEM